MEVRGVGSVGGALPADRASPAKPAEQLRAAEALSPTDEVEISAMGRLLDDASRMPGVREQRLAQIRAEIEAGTYDTPERLEAAVDRMLRELQSDNS